jgi:BirA family biotin operon repressor/biotin-[acetyl-CoA-carboxylase] ligase
LLLRPGCPLERTVQLAFVAGIAACEAIAALDRSLESRLALKWPNDILLEREKLGGILLESVSGGGGNGPAVVIGTGVNLASHPAEAAMPATSLASHAVMASAEEAFHRLADATAAWLDVWAEGVGWPTVREAWQGRSVATGTPISVKCGGRIVEGRFGGIDEQGGLRLETDSGEPLSITAGDIFLL